MSEAIEAVARVLAKAQDCTYEEVFNRATLDAEARAAIIAVRDLPKPTWWGEDQTGAWEMFFEEALRS